MTRICATGSMCTMGKSTAGRSQKHTICLRQMLENWSRRDDPELGQMAAAPLTDRRKRLPACAKSGAECRAGLCMAVDIVGVHEIDKQTTDENGRPGLAGC